MKQKLTKLAALALFAAGSLAHADASNTIKFIDGFGRLPMFMHGTHDSAQPPGPVGACNFKAAQSACVNAADTYTLNGCSVDSGKVVLAGSWDEAFKGPSADTCAMTLQDGESVIRTSKGLTATVQSGESIAGDTLAGTAYDGTQIPDTGIVTSLAGGVTTFIVNGSHMIYRDASGNQKEELFALTTAPVHMQGQPGDGSLIINDGSLRAFHQMDKYTSNVTVDKVAWSDKACCHPVSGTITEDMSGAKTGTRHATFTATCGAVQVVDVDGSTSTYNLPACQ